MNKKVSFGAKPRSAQAAAPAADAWVKDRASGEKEPMRRLTFDIPDSLHRQIKAQCAMRGTKIADELREMLREKYGNS
jgi:hypothetical protein